MLGVIWLAVMIAAAIALWRRRAPPVAQYEPMTEDPAPRRKAWIVGALLVATVVTIFILTSLSFMTQRPLFAGRSQSAGIRLIGHQWWWEVRYDGAKPSDMFTTANEIHIPVGTPIRLSLESADVIHSFWVPEPRRQAGPHSRATTTRSNLLAQRAGTYRGQCAEFCGLQHAHMGLADRRRADGSDFEKWQAAQRAAAAAPQESDRAKGAQVFRRETLRALPHDPGHAGGRHGRARPHPSRQPPATSRADVLPFDVGNLAAWIADPHGVKPGVNMPPVPLAPDELTAITAYLIGLK